MYEHWKEHVIIFVSKNYVNRVAKKEEEIKNKQTCIAMYNEAFHNNARIRFHFLRQNMNKTES